MRLPGKLVRGPVRPDRASFARFASLRWAALPIIDRRWTVPLSAMAIGFGIFVGVAIGPGTQGTEGAQGPLTVQVPPTEPETSTTTPDSGSGGSGGGGEGATGGAPGGGSPEPAPPPDTGIPSSPPPVSTPPISPTPPPSPLPPSSQPPATTPSEPAEPPTTTLTGTVVHINPHAKSYTIADDGRLVAIHSHRPPNLGKSIEVDARRLANGTYVEDGNRTEHGSNGQASFGGTVSFSDPRTDVYTVSAPGVSLLIRGTDGHLPRLGDDVDARVRIADDADRLPVRPAGEEGCGRPPALPKQPGKALEQVSLRIESTEATTTDVEGIVEGVCRDSRRLIVSADDLRESGRDISLLVPEELDIGAVKTGQVLRLTAEILDGGALRLRTVAGDEGGKGAQDEDLVQP